MNEKEIANQNSYIVLPDGTKRKVKKDQPVSYIQYVLDQLDKHGIQFAGGYGDTADYIVNADTMQAVDIDDFEYSDREKILDAIDNNEPLDIFYYQAEKQYLTDDIANTVTYGSSY